MKINKSLLVGAAAFIAVTSVNVFAEVLGEAGDVPVTFAVTLSTVEGSLKYTMPDKSVINATCIEDLRKTTAGGATRSTQKLTFGAKRVDRKVTNSEFIQAVFTVKKISGVAKNWSLVATPLVEAPPGAGYGPAAPIDIPSNEPNPPQTSSVYPLAYTLKIVRKANISQSHSVGNIYLGSMTEFSGSSTVYTDTDPKKNYNSGTFSGSYLGGVSAVQLDTDLQDILNLIPAEGAEAEAANLIKTLTESLSGVFTGSASEVSYAADPNLPKQLTPVLVPGAGKIAVSPGTTATRVGGTISFGASKLR